MGGNNNGQFFGRNGNARIGGHGPLGGVNQGAGQGPFDGGEVFIGGQGNFGGGFLDERLAVGDGVHRGDGGSYNRPVDGV